jgi:periplasmic divalent cation tolerance protein
MNSPLRLAYTTVPDLATAEIIAQTLVAEKLAACVTLIPQAISHYMWDGQATRSAEVILLIKTTAPAWPTLSTRLKNLHPYEIPALWALDPTTCDPTFLSWIQKSISLPE